MHIVPEGAMSGALRNIVMGILRNTPARVGSRRWFRERTGHESGCVICGAELPSFDPGRKHAIHGSRKFCSGRCRQKGYRLRRQTPHLLPHSGEGSPL